MTARRINSTISSLPLTWIDFFPFVLLLNSSLFIELVTWNTGSPFSGKLSIMSSAVLSHSTSELWVWVPYHLFSNTGPRNDQCPCWNFRVCSVILTGFAIQFSLFPRSPHTMSLYIDMKMVLPLNCSVSPLWFRHHLLDFGENSQCSESREICPLELHRLVIDSIRFSTLKRIFCSHAVDAELIYRNHCAKKHLDVSPIIVESGRLLAIFFDVLTFLFQRHWILQKLGRPDSVTIWEHHHSCSSVPISVWFIRTGLVPFLLWSRSQEWPTTATKPASALRNFSGILNTFLCVSVFSPHKVV